MWERGENLYFSEVSRHCIDRLFCCYRTAFMTSGSKPPLSTSLVRSIVLAKRGVQKRYGILGSLCPLEALSITQN